ncbi:prepilin-type N-terminal cleavage/methylation domain-containing protein [Clostridium sp. CAG:813]|nr:prepilin-type N-terminal cleavage/methylation domain-containing protein [Clostridium sp. CAG:813]
MLRQTCRHLGFTLAEVLITLGIIGVVAAMTIPTLSTNIRNKELQAQLKKTYSEWNQVSMQFMDDHEQSIPDYASENGTTGLIKEIPKYVKGVSKFSDWGYGVKDENGDNTTTMPYRIYAMKGGRTIPPCDAYGFRNDISGKTILFDDSPQSGFNGPRLCIDLNGDKRPNTMGIDIFSFQFTTDGHVIPEGTEHPNNRYRDVHSGGTVKASPTYCRGDNGQYNTLACTYYAIHDISPTGHGTYWKDYIGKKQYK